jgi:hypothetical protein
MSQVHSTFHLSWAIDLSLFAEARSNASIRVSDQHARLAMKEAWTANTYLLFRIQHLNGLGLQRISSRRIARAQKGLRRLRIH